EGLARVTPGGGEWGTGRGGACLRNRRVDGRSRSHPFADPGTTLEPFSCNGLPDGAGDMGKGRTAFYYKGLSPEDQRTFDRWLKANAIVGAIFATGLIAMALTSSRSVGRGDAEVASRTKASDVAVSEQRWRQPGVVTTQDPKVRSKLF